MIGMNAMPSHAGHKRVSSQWIRLSGWVRADRARAFFWFSLWLGVFLRLYVFAGGRMLWLDESMIALNLLTRSDAELFEPLNFLQIAPVGWLFANKLALQLTGSVDYGLRLVALIMGLGSLGLFAGLARRLFSMPVAASITLVFALSGLLVRYAAELKPYGSDIFFTLAVLCLVFLIWESSGQKARLYIGALALTGLIGLAFSFPLVYVLAGSVGLLIVRLWFGERRHDASLLAAAAVSWLVVFAVLMKMIYIGQAEGAGFRGGGVDHFFNRTGYAPFPPTRVADLVWYPRWAHHTAKFLFGEYSAYFGMILAGAGGVLMGRKRPWMLAIITAPLVLALFGSMLKAYPLYERLILFTLPLVLLLVAQSFEALRAELSARARLPVLAGALVAFAIGALFPLLDGLKTSPAFAKQDLGPALQIIAADYQPGDRLVVNTWAVPTYLLYRHRYGLEGTEWTIRSNGKMAGTCLASALGDLPFGTRIWSLEVDPGALPKTPARMPDFSAVFANSTYQMKTKFSAPEARLDLFLPASDIYAPDISDPRLCASDRDLLRELMGGQAPTMPPAGE